MMYAPRFVAILLVMVVGLGLGSCQKKMNCPGDMGFWGGLDKGSSRKSRKSEKADTPPPDPQVGADLQNEPGAIAEESTSGSIQPDREIIRVRRNKNGLVDKKLPKKPKKNPDPRKDKMPKKDYSKVNNSKKITHH